MFAQMRFSSPGWWRRRRRRGMTPVVLLVICMLPADTSGFISNPPLARRPPRLTLGSGACEAPRFATSRVARLDGLRSPTPEQRRPCPMFSRGAFNLKSFGTRIFQWMVMLFLAFRSSPAHAILRRAKAGVSEVAADPELLTQAVQTASTPSGKLSKLLALNPWPKLFTPRRVKIAALSIFTWMVLTSTIHHVIVRRRQAQDDTSEWSRYSNNAAQRTRAIIRLLTEQGMLLLATALVPSKRTKSSLRSHAAAKFATGVLRLGPLYIKMGQILSCQEDMLGPEWVDALARLQDRVPAKSGDAALDLAYQATPGGKAAFERIFSEFDPNPLAAASLGQVHLARLRTSGNDRVAVKLQRAHLREIYDQDLVLLQRIAAGMDKFVYKRRNTKRLEQSWEQIMINAEDILYREIDYRDEAEAGARFCRDFGIDKGGRPAKSSSALARNGQPLPSAAEWIRAPYVYREYCSEKMLVMEYVESVKISKVAASTQVPIKVKQDLADALARAYLRQLCCNLFFSTDPHPGNLGVEFFEENEWDNKKINGVNGKVNGSAKSSSTPKSPRLVLYDFGQAASLTQDQADGILEIIQAIVDLDVDKSMQAFARMGILRHDADLDLVRAKVADNYRTGKLKANRQRMERSGYVFAANETKLEEASAPSPADRNVLASFTMPAEYAFVARALTQLDGVGKSLDPTFDFISAAAPYLVEIKGADLYLQDEALKVWNSMQQRVTKFQSSLLGLKMSRPDWKRTNK